MKVESPRRETGGGFWIGVSLWASGMSYSEAISLKRNWPRKLASEDGMDAAGHLVWAGSYLKCAEQITLKNDMEFDLHVFAGPIMQIVGITTELTLKALLRGNGEEQAELKKVSHNTYEAYLRARVLFDEPSFIKLVMSNTSHLEVPTEVVGRVIAKGEDDPEVRWRVFFDHLKILDESYDRPYRSRYLRPGPIVLPEPLILLAGIKILQSAMRERCDLEPLAGASI
jgi:hypothetical protein